MKCKKCGGETWVKPEEVGVDRNNVPIYHRIAYCDSCMLKFDLDEHSNYVSDKKKESKRGIWGLVLSFFSSNILIALVSAFLCISALSKKDEKSVCGVLGLVLCVLLTFGTIVGGGSEDEYEDNSYASNTEVITQVSEETEAEVLPVETEEEYKASCQEYAYKDVLRNPENYVGQRIKITVEIASVHEASWLNDTKYYFARSDSDSNGYYYDDMYGVFDVRYSKDFKILEDDVIVVYGEISDPEYTTSLIVSGSEIFCIDMKYMDFISE